MIPLESSVQYSVNVCLSHLWEERVNISLRLFMSELFITYLLIALFFTAAMTH